MTNTGVHSVATDTAYVLKAGSGSSDTPVWAQLAITELLDVASTAPTTGQYLKWNGTAWEAASLASILLTIQEGDVTVDAAVTVIDFDASDFNVTSSPAGEGN